jgi:hypothetical protein
VKELFEDSLLLWSNLNSQLIMRILKSGTPGPTGTKRYSQMVRTPCLQFNVAGSNPALFLTFLPLKILKNYFRNFL